MKWGLVGLLTSILLLSGCLGGDNEVVQTSLPTSSSIPSTTSISAPITSTPSPTSTTSTLLTIPTTTTPSCQWRRFCDEFELCTVEGCLPAPQGEPKCNRHGCSLLEEGGPIDTGDIQAWPLNDTIQGYFTFVNSNDEDLKAEGEVEFILSSLILQPWNHSEDTRLIYSRKYTLKESDYKKIRLQKIGRASNKRWVHVYKPIDKDDFIQLPHSNWGRFSVLFTPKGKNYNLYSSTMMLLELSDFNKSEAEVIWELNTSNETGETMSLTTVALLDIDWSALSFITFNAAMEELTCKDRLLAHIENLEEIQKQYDSFNQLWGKYYYQQYGEPINILPFLTDFMSSRQEVSLQINEHLTESELINDCKTQYAEPIELLTNSSENARLGITNMLNFIHTNNEKYEQKAKAYWKEGEKQREEAEQIVKREF
ncbi:MAG: hypothetical protein ABH950_03165 [Candidatus Altiarchaeota archaeon]